MSSVAYIYVCMKSTEKFKELYQIDEFVYVTISWQNFIL